MRSGAVALVAVVAASLLVATAPAAADPAGTNVSATSGAASFVQPPDQTPAGVDIVYRQLNLERPTGGSGVDVAVVDTGVDTDHPDLRRRVELCRDFTTTPPRNGSCTDDNGHGTQVAGTVLADGGPVGEGIYGVAPAADLFAFKACDANGTCTSAALAAAVRNATDAGAEVILLSLGGDEDFRLENAIRYAAERDVLLVSAAGNHGPGLDTVEYPAADARVVAVGAAGRTASEAIVPENFRIPAFSARGRSRTQFREAAGFLEVVSPGVSVLSTRPDGGYGRDDGTSMAAPHVAGLAAKIWNGTPDADDDGTKHDDVRQSLRNRAEEFDITSGRYALPGYDAAAGFGVPTVRLPTASVSIRPRTPNDGEAVLLVGANSTSPDSRLVSYEWDLDNDRTPDASGVNATGVFDAGFQTVRLRVTDAHGATDVRPYTFEVNARPRVGFQQNPSVPDAGERVVFTAAGAIDVDGQVSAYEWDFNDDGVVDDRGRTVSTRFPTAGTRSVRLTVTDDRGATNSTLQAVQVNAPPTARFDVFPGITRPGVPILLDGTDSADPEGGDLEYAWDLDADGSVEARGPVVRPAYDEPGFHVVRLLVTDEHGATSTTSGTVLVNDVPELTVPVPGTVTAGSQVTLSAAVQNTVGDTDVTWRFPDGETATGTTVTRSFPLGNHTVNLTVRDTYGETARRVIVVRAVNETAPTTTTTTPGIPVFTLATALAALVVLVAVLALAGRRGEG